LKIQSHLQSISRIALSLGIVFAGVLPARAVTFEPPGERAPLYSTSGTSRDSDTCLGEMQAKTFVPVLPQSNIGLTIAGRPTFFVSLPDNTAAKILFSIQDEEHSYYYKTSLPSVQKAGILSIDLPQTAPELEIGKKYQWHVTLVCDGELEPDNPAVSGWVKRVKAPSPQVSREPSLKSLSLYGEKGIWHELLAALADLRKSQPNNADFIANWEKLLISVGLEKISSQPLHQ